MKLSKDPFFISTFVIGSIITVGSAIAIAIGFSGIGELGVCFKPECFTNFLTYYAFPFKAATATAAILGIVAMLHKSKQTAEQIALSTQQIQTTINQNQYLNYFSHLKDFKEQLSTLNFKTLKPFPYYGVYKSIFPNNSADNFNHLGTVDLLGKEFHTYLIKHQDSMSKVYAINQITDFDTAINIKSEHDRILFNLEILLNNLSFSFKDFEPYTFSFKKAFSNKDKTLFTVDLPDDDFYKTLANEIELIAFKLEELSCDKNQLDYQYIYDVRLLIDAAHHCYDLITDWAEEDYLSLVDDK